MERNQDRRRRPEISQIKIVRSFQDVFDSRDRTHHRQAPKHRPIRSPSIHRRSSPSQRQRAEYYSPPKLHSRRRVHFQSHTDGPEEIIPHNRFIRVNGEATSNLENLPERPKVSKQKQPSSPGQQIVELTRENRYLRQESAFYKETRDALMSQNEETRKACREIEYASVVLGRVLQRLENVTRKVD